MFPSNGSLLAIKTLKLSLSHPFVSVDKTLAEDSDRSEAWRRQMLSSWNFVLVPNDTPFLLLCVRQASMLNSFELCVLYKGCVFVSLDTYSMDEFYESFLVISDASISLG